MDFQKVLMLRDKMGSNDGATTKLYQKDETYDVSVELAEIFIRDKDAEAASEDATVTAPEYVEGAVYTDESGALFVGGVPDGQTEVTLLPIEQLTDDERAELVKEGKLNADGTAIDAKAIDAAPKNKAIARAPKNKAK